MAEPPFRLASVLAYREAQLDASVQEAGKLETQLRALEDCGAELARARQAALNRTEAGERRAAEFRLVADYLDGLEGQSTRIGREIVRVGAELGRAKTRLIARHQAVSALRRLRERHGAAAREAAERREQSALDELASLQAERRRRA